MLLFGLLLLRPAALRCQDGSAQTEAGKQAVERALRANDLPAAEQGYRAMLQQNASDVEALTGLGVLLYGSGRSVEASDLLQKALALSPSAPRAEIFLGLSQAELHHCDRATPLLQRRFDEQAVGKLQRLSGLALLACGSSATDVVPALEIAAKLKKLYPGDPDVLYESAELDTRLWNQDAAELMDRHPESYRVHQLAGEVYEAQGNAEQAVREYRLALAENPRLPQMHFRVGQLLLQKPDSNVDDLALAEFRAELKVNPRSAVAYLAMGEIDRHQHQLDEALDEYRQAAQLDPDLVAAPVGAAQVLLEQHQLQPCLDLLHTVVRQHPDDPEAHYALMLAYRTKGDMSTAGQEMALFKKLQQRHDQQFQNKLNALLNDKTQGDTPHVVKDDEPQAKP